MPNISVYHRTTASLVWNVTAGSHQLQPRTAMGCLQSAVVLWSSSWGLQALSEPTPYKVGAAAWQAAQGRQNQMGLDKHKAAAPLTLFILFWWGQGVTCWALGALLSCTLCGDGPAHWRYLSLWLAPLQDVSIFLWKCLELAVFTR